MDQPIQIGDRITNGRITGMVVGTVDIVMGCGVTTGYRVRTPAGEVRVIPSIYARKAKK